MSGTFVAALLDAAVPSFLLLLGLRVVLDEAPAGKGTGVRLLLTVLLVPVGIVFAYRVGSLLLGMLQL